LNIERCGVAHSEIVMPESNSQPSFAKLPLEELGASGFSLAMQMLGRRDDAADAVQDALHQTVRKWRSFDAERGELKAWFLKIVRNRCIDMIRRRTRHRTEPAELEQLTVPAMQRPDTIAEQREIHELLRSELMSMPADQREIILLRDFHNLCYAEVAQILAVPKGTVMSRLHRARVALRGRMEKYQ